MRIGRAFLLGAALGFLMGVVIMHLYGAEMVQRSYARIRGGSPVGVLLLFLPVAYLFAVVFPTITVAEEKDDPGGGP